MSIPGFPQHVRIHLRDDRAAVGQCFHRIEKMGEITSQDVLEVAGQGLSEEGLRAILWDRLRRDVSCALYEFVDGNPGVSFVRRELEFRNPTTGHLQLSAVVACYRIADIQEKT